MFKEPDGTNQRMRRLLGTEFKTVTFSQAREGSPRASNPSSLVIYQSTLRPPVFVAGVGMTVPDKVERWTIDEPVESA